MYQLIVDNREQKSVQDAFLAIHECIIKQVDVGDIHINYNDKPIVVIERKEINDLASSLQDGRYHEQKSRLKNLQNCRIIYLIEGSYKQVQSKYHRQFNEEVYKGIITNTIIRDGIQVITTNNLDETIVFIKGILHRLPKYINELVQEHITVHKNLSSAEVEYTNAIDICKKDNNTPKVCFINQLRQIQGISVNVAQEIADNYPNMVELIVAYQEKGEALIADLKCNNRRIGNVISKRLFDFLRCIANPP